MKLPQVLFLIAALTWVAGCKRYAASPPLKDVPPPILAQGWQSVMRKDLSFTIALPPEATVMDLPGMGEGPSSGVFGGEGGFGSFMTAGGGGDEQGAGFIAFMSGSNALLNGLMTELAKERMGASDTSASTSNSSRLNAPASAPFKGEMAIIALAEGFSDGDSAEAIADEVESVLNQADVELKVERAPMELPVGKAIRVRGDHWDSRLNQNLTVIVYCLSDANKKSYAGMFITFGPVGKDAGFSPKDIMSTFRVRR